MTELYNKTSEKDKRKYLRNNMPPAEQLVWTRLKGRQIEGYKFRRQYSVGAFVIDFYSVEIKLAIEIVIFGTVQKLTILILRGYANEKGSL